eukprot:Rmarinus@m.15857
MCRLMVYQGRPILLANLLTRPSHSIINQSFTANMMLNHSPLNGDGFGVGWYSDSPLDDSIEEPCIFTSISPAWNSRNLRRLAEKISSKLCFAHVRAASPGLGQISEQNCHPFQWGRYMFMHNGDLPGFPAMKRRIREALRDDVYNWIAGTTDSEHLFALFINNLRTTEEYLDRTELKETFDLTIQQLIQIAEAAEVDHEPMYMNIALTDGRTVLVSRYVSLRQKQPSSLFFASGTRFECDRGDSKMLQSERREDVLIVCSEPLTNERADWLEVPANHLLVASGSPALNILCFPLEYAAEPSSQDCKRRRKVSDSIDDGLPLTPSTAAALSTSSEPAKANFNDSVHATNGIVVRVS